MRLFCCLLLFWGLAGCRPTASDQPVGNNFQLEDYTVEDIPDTDLQKVTKYNDEGRLVEMGFVLNGLAEGAWVYYGQSNEFPDRVINYHRGRAQGPYLEIGERGQLETKAYYRNNQLHGDWSSYQYGRLLKTATYKNGQLDGIYREYSFDKGMLQKVVHYRDGQMHGPYLYYDESGEVSLEYQYENGVQVTGSGAVEE